MRRSSARTVVVAVCASLLAGCTSEAQTEEAQAALDESAHEVDAVVAELLPQLAAASATELTGGTTSFRLCGDPVPSGASYVSSPRLGPTTAVSDGDPKANIEAVLLSEGWEVDDADDGLRLVARRDGILLLGDVAPGGANLTFTADCVDAPADVAREFSGRASKDVPLPG